MSRCRICFWRWSFALTTWRWVCHYTKQRCRESCGVSPCTKLVDNISSYSMSSSRTINLSTSLSVLSVSKSLSLSFYYDHPLMIFFVFICAIFICSSSHVLNHHDTIVISCYSNSVFWGVWINGHETICQPNESLTCYEQPEQYISFRPNLCHLRVKGQFLWYIFHTKSNPLNGSGQ